MKVVMSQKNQSRALVTTPKLSPPAKIKSSESTTIKLVDDTLHLKDKEQVRKYLPDILGRVLACIWIDQEFHMSFANNPKGTLEKYDVHIPSDMFIDFESSKSDRPKVIVYEKKKDSKFKLRVMYLQLVMMAGR